MKLYHYSDKQYTELLTRRVQGADEKEIDIATFKAKRMGLPLPYHDHISFFFEPIPLDKIASVFPYGHPFWKAGNEIYEHVIDLDSIDPTSVLRDLPKHLKVLRRRRCSKHYHECVFTN